MFFTNAITLWNCLVFDRNGKELITRILLAGGILFFGLIVSVAAGRLELAGILLRRTNRLFRMLSECNQVLVRTGDEQTLLQKVCELIVQIGGYRFAWVGFIEDGPERRVQRAALFGEGEDFSGGVSITGSEGESGGGPVGRAIRTGRTAITPDIARDPAFAPWREHVLARGLRSSITLPIRDHDRVIGALDILSDRVQELESEEVALLEELAGDLSYSITALRTRKERDRSLAALRESEAEFRAICDHAPIGIARVDKNGRFYYINPHFHKMLGYSLADLADKNGFDITHPDDIERNRRLSIGLHAGKCDMYSLEKRYIRKDGSAVWVDMHVSAVRGDKETPGYQIAIIEDISERRAAEAARQRLAAIVDSTPDAIVSSDLERLILDWNKGAERMYGYKAEEAIGLKMDILMPSDRHDEALRVVDRLRQEGRIKPFESTRLRKDGSLANVSISIAPIFDDEGKIVGAAGIHRDLTELTRAHQEKERLEAQIRQAQKMEAVGTLAGGIAHDFNNILSAMIGYSELALMEVPDGSKPRHYLDQVLGAGMRAKELVSQILSFSRQSGPEEKKPVLLEPIVKETLKLIRATLPATIEIEQRIDDEPGWIEGDPTQLHQVVMNLCTNAAHAMQDQGGVLTVAAERVEVDESSARQHLGLAPGPHVRLTVGDTGVGMDAATRDRIFEPFFTTKPKGEGTGMGLAVVHGIVRGHGGVIKVYSEPGRGSSFQVYFPAIRDEAESSAADVDVPPPGGTESILIVETTNPCWPRSAATCWNGWAIERRP